MVVEVYVKYYCSRFLINAWGGAGICQIIGYLTTNALVKFPDTGLFPSVIDRKMTRRADQLEKTRSFSFQGYISAGKNIP